MQPYTTSSPHKPQTFPQPLHVMQVPEALLKIQTVVAVTGLSKSSIARKVALGAFPQPVKDGTRCTRWVSRDVTNWLRSRAPGIVA